MDETPLHANGPRPIHSWPALLPFGLLVEEYQLPPHFDMTPHVHETGHGWLLLEGGFEQDSGDSVRWRSPGEFDSYEGGTIHRIHVGDRGCHCVVFENVFPSSTVAQTRPMRAAESIAIALQRVVNGESDALGAWDAVNALAVRERVRMFRREPDWIHEADEFIGDRFHGPLRAGDVARHVGLHRAHLVREYRQFRGRTVADQVRMLRLDYARNLLVRRELPLIALALEAGFSDQSHFTREFSSRYGASPRRYLTDGRRSA